MKGATVSKDTKLVVGLRAQITFLSFSFYNLKMKKNRDDTNYSHTCEQSPPVEKDKMRH